MKCKPKNKFLRFLLFLLLTIVLVILIFIIWYHLDTQLSKPSVDKSIVNKLHRETAGTDQYQIGNNWLKKNTYGLWEMYLEGPAFERGVVSGKLTRELIYKQEKSFVDQIREMIPSESYLNFLKYFIRFFNRDIDEYILPEYQEEIYGISFSASDDFDFIGTKYERMLNYHAAHDVGHALQDLMLVGCTSFAANMGFADSSMIIGRNFDFYINDAFAEDKIICFVRPDEGHEFAYITWASMIGVVSGMNNKGLTVTINAGKSDVPFRAATPISLLAREILQYAANIEEAIEISKKRKTFVSESLLIGSASDNQAVIIEKSPSKFGVYSADNEFLVCSNHFQSETFAGDENNNDQISTSASLYRQNRTIEMLNKEDTISYLEAADILRNRWGLNEQPIGIGNEKAMAQMISHHSVIFQPLKRNIWISTAPYQLGEFLNYNLSDFFSVNYPNPSATMFDTAYTIPDDPFQYSVEFKNYLQYKSERLKLKEATQNKILLEDDYIDYFIALNPGYFESYVLAADYYFATGNSEKALQLYTKSRSKEFEKTSQRMEVEEKIQEIENRP
ncbi:MAG: C45 family peptidase [Bacteroidetes bacterium]|nr:C45 family peptidase [Bacteroidota bacterium]